MNSSMKENNMYFSGNAPLKSLLPAVRGIVLAPGAFFAGMPRAIYYRDALFFVSVVIFGCSFLSVPFYSMLFLFLLPATWGLGLIGMWLWSRYLSWAVKGFTDARLSPANAFQLSAYAALPMLLAAIPYLGWIALLWNLYLLWQGLVSFCRLRAGVAAAIVLLPVLILGLSLVALGSVALQLLPQLAG